MIMSQRPYLTIISPVYRAEKIVDELVSRIREEASKITNNYEIILIEDCGPDNSWSKIVENCKRFQEVKGIKLSRNFGQHYAVTAGINNSTGDFIVILDCDLQDNPSLIHDLLAKANEGFDIVFTTRKKRKHSLFKNVTAYLYSLVFLLIADKDYSVNMGSLVLFNSRVKEEFVKLNDQDRLYIQLLKWIGFRQTSIEVEHQPRHSGNSTYSLLKLIKIAFQGLTSHSDKLLRLSIYSGFSISFLSFISLILITILYFTHGFQVGWASIISVILLSTGLILISIGIAGIYIGKNFTQTKNRPLYIIYQKQNFNS
jgi:glycosyltransferase involved in cell wall biosynthesis